MPVKRRISKRHRLLAQMSRWEDLFEYGHDWFGDHAELGYGSEAEMKADAPEAWSVLGAAFLAHRQTQGPVWALVQFGEPSRCP
ncbi:hypothetical protein [Mesorhizobium sp. AA23]|uniref:hypothetical protein n=1 Tax=Mesorhizobium sp. AA23 TaxID=1854058 RepID=UPI0007FDB3B7|nr:hypothetical protein [Mesorhizobium sp. AA23]OBQ94158.1 hypothetical protein A9K66_27955 [Mesorhizobium sp. AA23]